MLQAGHPNDHVLDLYCMEKLSELERETIEDHLLLCESCQNRAEDTDRFVRAMRGALAAPTLQNNFFSFDWKPYFQLPAPVWATAGLAALGVVGFFAVTHGGVNQAPLAIALSATRGGFVPAVPAEKPLDLDLDTRDLPSTSHYRVQVVTGEGREVWSGTPSSIQDGHLHALVSSRLAPGQYFVRIADASGTRREFAMRLGK